MSTQYVEQHEGVYRVASSRVSLDSLVYAFWDGKSAETIAQFGATVSAQGAQRPSLPHVVSNHSTEKSANV